MKTEKIHHFHYSHLSKIPFKAHSFMEVMNLRMIDFSESAELLIKNNHIIPSLPLIRALFENIAITNRVVASVEESLLNNKLDENFDELISKILFGTKIEEADEIPAINILTQIDKLDKNYSGLRKFYDSLSEFVHPNSDGVIGSYSELHEDKNYTEIFKVFTVDYPVYKWIESCFILCLDIFLDFANRIRINMRSFTILCEHELEIKQLGQSKGEKK